MDYGLLMIDCCVQTAAVHVGALKMTLPEHQEFNKIASAKGRILNFDIPFLIFDISTGSRLPTSAPLILNPYNLLLTTYNSLILLNKANFSW
jgi:hypothetical protein